MKSFMNIYLFLYSKCIVDNLRVAHKIVNNYSIKIKHFWEFKRLYSFSHSHMHKHGSISFVKVFEEVAHKFIHHIKCSPCWLKQADFLSCCLLLTLHYSIPNLFPIQHICISKWRIGLLCCWCHKFSYQIKLWKLKSFQLNFKHIEKCAMATVSAWIRNYKGHPFLVQQAKTLIRFRAFKKPITLKGF